MFSAFAVRFLAMVTLAVLQPPAPVAFTPALIVGDVEVRTLDSHRATAVAGSGRVPLTRERTMRFVFCIAHEPPLQERLAYRGHARVHFLRPTLSDAKNPVGVDRTVLPTLAVLVPGEGAESLFFLGPQQVYAFPPNERSVGRRSTFEVADVTLRVWKPTGSDDVEARIEEVCAREEKPPSKRVSR